MHAISLWASRHPWPARLLIIVGFVLLTEVAFFIGITLQLLDLALPLLFFYAAVVVFIAVFLLYPDKKYSHWFNNSYGYQKACDVLLIGATFVMLVFIGNRPEHLLQPTTPQAIAAVPLPATSGEPSVKTRAKNIQPVLNKLSKKSLRRLLFKRINQLRSVYKKTSTGGKIALIVLSLIVAFGVFYLLAALACSISCSGSEGLAVFVFLLGTAVIVFFLVRTIRRIVRGPRSKRTTPAPAPSTGT